MAQLKEILKARKMYKAIKDAIERASKGEDPNAIAQELARKFGIKDEQAIELITVLLSKDQARFEEILRRLGVDEDVTEFVGFIEDIVYDILKPMTEKGK